MVQVVSFAGPFTDTGEHRVATEQFRDVIDQFHDQNRLAHTGTAEQANLAALHVWAEQVDDLDTGDEHFGFGRLVDEFRRFCVDRAAHVCIYRAAFVDRLTDHVHDAAECGRADGNHDWSAGIGNCLTAHEPLRGVHGDGADRVLAEVLGNLKHQAVAIIVGFERVEDGGQFAVEFDVDNSTDNLGHAAFSVCGSAHAGRLLWSGYMDTVLAI